MKKLPLSAFLICFSCSASTDLSYKKATDKAIEESLIHMGQKVVKTLYGNGKLSDLQILPL